MTTSIGHAATPVGRKFLIFALWFTLLAAEALAQPAINLLYEPVLEPPRGRPTLRKFPDPPQLGQEVEIRVEDGTQNPYPTDVFVGWADEAGTLVTTNRSYVFTADRDRTFTAVFGTRIVRPTPWTEGVIPFEFGPGVSAARKLIMLQEMDKWAHETESHIAFVPYRGTTLPHPPLMRIDSGNPGRNTYSPIGMPVLGTLGTMVIGDWDQPHLIAHELGHVLGLQHTHQHPHRVRYLGVDWSQLPSDGSLHVDYSVKSLDDWLPGDYNPDNTGEAFDIRSIMNYAPRPNEFSVPYLIAKPTVPAQDAAVWNNPAFRPTMTLSDLRHVWNIYGKGGESRIVDSTRTGGEEKGSPSQPYLSLKTGAGYNAARNDPGSRLWVNSGTHSVGSRLEGPQKILPYPGDGPVRIVP